MSRRTLTTMDQLAKAARDGDAAATEQFLLALHEHLVGAVRKLGQRRGYRSLGVADLEDAAHELLLVLWREDLPQWREQRGSFLTFANIRIRWTLASGVRRLSRFSAEDAPEVEVERGDVESVLEDVATERALLRLVKLVDDLEPLARSVVRRVDLREEPLTRVAHHKNLHVTRACRIRQRAHKELALGLALAA